MAKLKRKGNYETVKDAVLGNCHCSEDELLNPTLEDPRAINNLYNAAVFVIRAIQQKLNITIVGDYDSDGLNATAILVKLFRHYGVEPETVIPRRISDGYGLSKNIIDNIKTGLVITIDNGIAAVEEISALKKKGCYVIVMDHHLPQKKLPEADLIVDPHVDPKKNGFVDYCGAGLGLQLARLVLEQDKSSDVPQLLKEMTAHAAIATITDVMPLIGSNRRIVMDGISYMANDPEGLGAGLSALLSVSAGKQVNEDVIGFQFGPIINAPARLYDAGGASVLKEFLESNREQADAFMAKMVDINNKRKALVAQAYAQVSEQIEKENLLSRGSPLVVYSSGLPEGILGIIAGKLAENYKMPAFMFSDSKGEPEIIKGSGRAGANGNLEPLIEPLSPLCVACGGHTGAMGVSVKREMFPQMDAKMREVMAGTEQGDPNLIMVDVVLDAKDVPQAYKETQMYAPYGEGFRKPTVLIRNFTAVKKFGSHFQFLGGDNKTLKVNGENFDLIGFNLADKYAAEQYPTTMDVVGTIGSNTFKGKTTIQIEIKDFAAKH